MQPYNMNLINDNVPYLYISTMDGTIPIKSILESLYERLSIIYYFDFFLFSFQLKIKLWLRIDKKKVC